jgi:molybdopterin-guanine dinucleotide biosynthesis protein A
MHISHIVAPVTAKPYTDVTGVILAGGRSRRMGQDKATLEVAGTTLFARTLAMLRGLFPCVLIAGDRPDLARAEVPCVPDIYPGSALGGIHGGLAAATTPWIFVAPCDLAYPDPELARFILGHRDGYDVVVPRTPGGFEPVFALYHRNCLPAMEAMLARGDYRIYDFYEQMQVRYLAAEELPPGWERSLLNLNTPEDLRRMDKEAP